MRGLSAGDVLFMRNLSTYLATSGVSILGERCSKIADAIEAKIQTPAVPDTVKGDEDMGLM